MISTVFARKVVAVANGSLNKTELLKAYGINPEDSPDLLEMIPDHQYYDLLEQVSEADPAGDPISLRVGATMRCDDYGALGLSWKSAANLRNTLELAIRYARLMTSVSTYDFKPQGSDFFFVLNRVGHPRAGLLTSNEATMASIKAFSQELTGGRFVPKSVHFKHDAPQDTRPYEQYFGCPVHFNSELNALLISSQVLALPNRLGDVGISQFLESHLEAELSKLKKEESLEHQVQAQISKAISSGVPKMVDIAKRLGMSERTLHRRLNERELSYHSLVNQTRKELAESLLTNTRYSLMEVAFLTGFSEQSAFQRAFKRWFQQTPTAFRQASFQEPSQATSDTKNSDFGRQGQ